jgi:hypothetical protein
LIISSYMSVGQGSMVAKQALGSQLLSNALEAARGAATQDGLVNTIPLRPDETGLDVPCWTSVSETPERDVLFLTAVAQGDRGALLATLEGPCEAELIDVFRAFLKSLRHPAS